MAAGSKRLIHRAYQLGQRRCHLCGVQLVYKSESPRSATFEHLVPKSMGGTFAMFNGLMICKGCNKERGNQCWVRWIKKRNPPKKEWLIKKYYEAVAQYEKNGRRIKIRKEVRKQALIQIKNLTVNIHPNQESNEKARLAKAIQKAEKYHRLGWQSKNGTDIDRGNFLHSWKFKRDAHNRLNQVIFPERQKHEL